jgi:HAD superfamily hydrolase (TIGR01490 family)
VQKTLALFDIDGTLTTADTMFAYARHVVGLPRFVAGLVWMSPMLALARVGVINPGTAKGRMLQWMFRAHSRAQLEDAARSFVRTVFPQLLRAEGIARLQRHRDRGDTVFLVSASLDLWLAPFAEAHAIPLICTATRWHDDRFAGLGGPNCRGQEKVRRVRAAVNPLDYATIEAYGDSSGDTQMLAMSTIPHFQPFRED